MSVITSFQPQGYVSEEKKVLKNKKGRKTEINETGGRQPPQAIQFFLPVYSLFILSLSQSVILLGFRPVCKLSYLHYE